MLRTSLLGAPVLVVVLLLHGSAPSSSLPNTTALAPTASPVMAFTLPAPPATDLPTTTVPPTTTTEAPTTTTEPPTTAPPETAAPETSPPTEATTAAPKPRRTTTSSEAPPATDPPGTEPPATAPPNPVATPGDASAVIGLANQQRAAAGLGPLTANGALHTAAQRESNDMAAHTTMSHTGSDGSTVATRATAAGYAWHALGENIAAGYGSASGVMAGWMASAGHRANILNGTFKDIGVAVATGADGNKYWTMVLGA
jgi:uncharacterized protein YkwD